MTRTRPYKTGEAAHELGVSPRTVRRLLETGRLPGCRLPGLWLIDRDDMTAYRRTAR